jgi:hypothetical protein
VAGLRVFAATDTASLNENKAVRDVFARVFSLKFPEGIPFAFSLFRGLQLGEVVAQFFWEAEKESFCFLLFLFL